MIRGAVRAEVWRGFAGTVRSRLVGWMAFSTSRGPAEGGLLTGPRSMHDRRSGPSEGDVGDCGGCAPVHLHRAGMAKGSRGAFDIRGASQCTSTRRVATCLHRRRSRRARYHNWICRRVSASGGCRKSFGTPGLNGVGGGATGLQLYPALRSGSRRLASVFEPGIRRSIEGRESSLLNS